MFDDWTVTTNSLLLLIRRHAHNMTNIGYRVLWNHWWTNKILLFKTQTMRYFGWSSARFILTLVRSCYDLWLTMYFDVINKKSGFQLQNWGISITFVSLFVSYCGNLLHSKELIETTYYCKVLNWKEIQFWCLTICQ